MKQTKEKYKKIVGDTIDDVITSIDDFNPAIEYVTIFSQDIKKEYEFNFIQNLN